MVISLTNFADALNSISSHYFPFPMITTPILVIIGVLVTAKVSSAVLRMVTGGG